MLQLCCNREFPQKVRHGGRVVMHWVKLPAAKSLSQVSAGSLPIHLPADAPGEAAEDGPFTLVGDPDGVPGSWLRAGLVLAMSGLLGGGPAGGGSLSLSLHLFVTLPFK